jgi:H+-translocating NAD(P) transhydrogenase subunit beta
MDKYLIEILYLVASLSFVIGLKMMGKPDSARKGNLIAAAGMGIAVFGTLFFGKDGFAPIANMGLIMVAIAIGTTIGWLMAKRVQMTKMPEMVSLFNGMGGLCAGLISVIEWKHLSHTGEQVELLHYLPILAGLIIGTVSFVGSIVAWGKLNGSFKDILLPGQQVINFIALGGITFCSVMLFQDTQSALWFYGIIALSSVYGLLFVFPIGGADMPVVISLLNSFTGMAAACGGFMYDNKVMLMGGILVGSAGTILTIVMCKAMNRSLKNVLLGNFGGGSTTPGTSNASGGSVREVQSSDVAIMMKYANRVIIIPGYGLAVAQAQHVCHEMEEMLEADGVEVKYAIHPVAGRMPGHMNVLLAESNVSYDKMIEMEHINSDFASTDVVLVIGANDVVNPAAKTDPSSPIYGMPILDAESAKQIIVLKRSMKAGYAGIENELFFNPKTGMLFGDAKESIQKLVAELKML